MSKFDKSPKKDAFLSRFPATSIASSDIEVRFKFNFSFFDSSQEHGAGFDAVGADMLVTIMLKMKDYSRHDLNYWRHQRCGGGGLKVLADYGPFPPNSNFTHPKSVPHDANWCRFRLDNLARLIGFTIPGGMRDKSESGSVPYDKNVFYLVFIDLDHNFYITEDR